MKNNNKSKWQQAREIKKHTSRIIKLHLEGREALQRQLTRLIDENRASNSINNMTKHTVKVTLDAYRAYLEKPSEENYLNFEKFKKIADGMLFPEAKNKLNALVLAHKVCFNDKTSVKDNTVRIRCAMKDDLGAQINKLISAYPDIQTSIKIQKIINDSTITLRRSLRQTGKRQSFLAYQKTRDAINSAMRVHHVSTADMERMNKYIDEFHGSIKAEAVAKKVRNKNISYIPGEASISFKSETDSQDFRQKRNDIAILSGLSNVDITVNVKPNKAIISQGKPKAKAANAGLFAPRKRTVLNKSKPIVVAKKIVSRASETIANRKQSEKAVKRKQSHNDQESVGVFSMSPDMHISSKQEDLENEPNTSSSSTLPKKAAIVSDINVEIKKINELIGNTKRIENEAVKLPTKEKVEKLLIILKNYHNAINLLEEAELNNKELIKLDVDSEQISMNNSYIEETNKILHDRLTKTRILVVHYQKELKKQEILVSDQPIAEPQNKNRLSTTMKRDSLFSHQVRVADSLDDLNNSHKNKK